MGELYQSIRLRQSDFINQNKASIIISRTTRTSDGAGGYIETPSTLASQDFRTYAATSGRDMSVLLVNDGGYHRSRIKKMVALWDADIEAENETFLDTFSHDGIDYKVCDVKSMTTQGFVVFKEIYVEEVT